MKTNTSTKPQDWREWRRLRAWELKQQGWAQQAIAAALGVTPGAVSQWITKAVAGVSRRCAIARRRGRNPV